MIPFLQNCMFNPNILNSTSLTEIQQNAREVNYKLPIQFFVTFPSSNGHKIAFGSDVSRPRWNRCEGLRFRICKRAD